MGIRKFKQLSERDRVLISHLRGRGLSFSEIGRRIGKDKSTISRELRRNAKTVTAEDRLFWVKIQNLWFDEDVERYLATLPGTEREALTATTRTWFAKDAQSRARFRRWLSNQKRRRKKPRTRRWVVEKLKLGWSPEQIAGRSKINAPESVSHEYVYAVLIT